ncbi:hypothetical protein PsYK624_134940 [Phanerochaete sordida]|uniref:F-box domain-containing protein n=1 Tax=Phanerochaete sordida TaxID=48140 RepID=A0A9P3GJY2_9APHY|nr:hypothetical protein PsYK624_134940 [Phanerochaete sordida]
MHVELGLYEALVLAVIGLVYSMKSLHDVQPIARSYHDNGPWSPFEDANAKSDEHSASQSSQSSLAPGSSAFPSPSESPLPSQVPRAPIGEVSSEYEGTSSALSSRSVSTMSSNDEDELPASTFADRILSNDLLYDLILLFSTPSVLLRLARVCRGSHAAVRSHIARCFNINTHIAHFFTAPLAFRSLQARTGALISGSNALQFFDRVHYPEADLDIYCAYEARAEVGWWLIEREGYTFKPHSRQDASFHVALEQARVPGTPAAHPYSRLKAVSAVYTFTKRVENARGPSRWLKVQIIVAYNCPMEAIFDFHSTAVLNVISYSHAYSLYPRATFHHRTALALLPERRLEAPVKAKYESRGYTFIHSVPSLPPALPDGVSTDLMLRLSRPRECAHCPHCAEQRERDRSVAEAFPLGLRWIGDRHSWVLPLDMAGVERATTLPDDVSPAPSRDPCVVTSWEMVPRVERDGTFGRAIRAKVRRPEGFWHCYVVSDPKLKKAMKMVQELYVDIPDAAGEDVRYCDEEFIRWSTRMLEDEQMWDRWYPSGRANPEFEIEF